MRFVEYLFSINQGLEVNNWRFKAKTQSCKQFSFADLLGKAFLFFKYFFHIWHFCSQTHSLTLTHTPNHWKRTHITKLTSLAPLRLYPLRMPLSFSLLWCSFLYSFYSYNCCHQNIIINLYCYHQNAWQTQNHHLKEYELMPMATSLRHSDLRGSLYAISSMAGISVQLPVPPPPVLAIEPPKSTTAAATEEQQQQQQQSQPPESSKAAAQSQTSAQADGVVGESSTSASAVLSPKQQQQQQTLFSPSSTTSTTTSSASKADPHHHHHHHHHQPQLHRRHHSHRGQSQQLKSDSMAMTTFSRQPVAASSGGSGDDEPEPTQTTAVVEHHHHHHHQPPPHYHHPHHQQYHHPPKRRVLPSTPSVASGSFEGRDKEDLLGESDGDSQHLVVVTANIHKQPLSGPPSPPPPPLPPPSALSTLKEEDSPTSSTSTHSLVEADGVDPSVHHHQHHSMRSSPPPPPSLPLPPPTVPTTPPDDEVSLVLSDAATAVTAVVAFASLSVCVGFAELLIAEDTSLPVLLLICWWLLSHTHFTSHFLTFHCTLKHTHTHAAKSLLLPCGFFMLSGHCCVCYFTWWNWPSSTLYFFYFFSLYVTSLFICFFLCSDFSHCCLTLLFCVFFLGIFAFSVFRNISFLSLSVCGWFVFAYAGRWASFAQLHWDN